MQTHSRPLSRFSPLRHLCSFVAILFLCSCAPSRSAIAEHELRLKLAAVKLAAVQRSPDLLYQTSIAAMVEWTADQTVLQNSDTWSNCLNQIAFAGDILCQSPHGRTEDWQASQDRNWQIILGACDQILTR